MRPRIALTACSLVSVLLLSACSTGNALPTSRAAAPAAKAVVTVTNEPVSLAYDPAGKSLLLADQRGLARWHAGVWEQLTVPGASGLSAVTLNPEAPATIYVAGPGLGVVRSDDGGAGWRAVNSGLPNLNATALVIHSFKCDSLYAWLRGEGVFQTEDGGASWKRVPDQGPPDKDVRGLTHSTLPGSMNTGWLYAATPTGAYLSMDCF